MRVTLHEMTNFLTIIGLGPLERSALLSIMSNAESPKFKRMFTAAEYPAVLKVAREFVDKLEVKSGK